MHKEEVILLLLRVGLAFAFIYPAVAAFLNPVAWIGFFPPFVLDAAPNESAQFFLLYVFGAVEMAIGLWLLAGQKIFIPSVLAALILIGIVIFNWQLMDVVFRDIPILLSAIALAVWSYPKQQ